MAGAMSLQRAAALSYRRPAFNTTPCKALRPARRPQLAPRAEAAAAATSDAAAANGAAPLFEPLQLGPFQLNHRVVLAPLTRCRALGSLPQPNMAVYYAQRTTPGGLLISEATSVSERGYGYPCVPGLHSAEQVEAWRPVVDAVHDKGGIFFAQIWHAGRASHPDYQPDGGLPVSASALPITDGNQVVSPKTFQLEDYPTPRALDASEIPGVIKEFADAARNARAAGFDGVELHGASGYLINQFLVSESNQRTDAYGGSIENRCRFVLELLEEVAAAIGPERVGLRLMPFGGFLSNRDAHPYALYTYLLEELNTRFKGGLAYVHMVGPRSDYDGPEVSNTLEPFRKVYKGTFIAASGYNRDLGAEAVSKGEADLIAYGRYFISNPDLVERFRRGAPLNRYNRDLFYAQSDEGYIDYPFLSE